MFGRRIITGWFVIALMVVLPLAITGATAAFQKPPIANLDLESARIDWLPQVDYEHLTLLTRP